MENRTQKRIPDLWWLLLLEGIATIILGILFISQPAGTLKVFVIFLGVYWLIEGIFSLIRIFTHSGRAHWAWSLLSGILGIVAGILVLSQPMLSSMILTTTIVIIIAIQGILIGILDIVRGVQGDGAGDGTDGGEPEGKRDPVFSGQEKVIARAAGVVRIVRVGGMILGNIRQGEDFMGKGDQRSKRGKIHRGTNGKTRPRSRKRSGKPAPAKD